MTEDDQSHSLPSVAVDRRQQKRMPLRLPVRIISRSATAEVCHEGTCVDISEAGLAFVTAGDLHVGEIVDLEFRQQDEIYRYQARLFYRARRRYGGCFIERPAKSTLTEAGLQHGV
jgi:PilZ domain